jgi:predicted small secreted protein
MAFRRTHLLAACVVLAAGVVVSFACNTTRDEQLGGTGQLCFANESCDDGLTCVRLPLEGGGFEGGECFDLHEASEEETSPDALEEVADDGGDDVGEATDSPEDAPSAEAGSDAKTD